MKSPRQNKLCPVIGRELTRISNRRTLWRVKISNLDGNWNNGVSRKGRERRASKTRGGEGRKKADHVMSIHRREVFKSSMPSLHY